MNDIEKSIDQLQSIREKARQYMSLTSKDNSAWINALTVAISALQQQLTGGWIPVSSGRLPKEKISPITHDYYDYECTFTTDRVTEVRFYKFGDGHWWHGSGCVDEYITAWRERPEPWKEDAK